VSAVRARWIAGVLVVGTLASAGCASLLGDFSSQDIGDGGSIVLTTDSGAVDSGAAPDGSAAEGATSPVPDAGAPLSCKTWRYADPFVLETLDAGNRRVSGTLTLSSGPGAQARVIAGKSTTGVAFSAYTIDSSDPDAAAPGVTQLDAPTIPGAEYAGWANGSGSTPATQATTVLAYAPAGDGGTLGAFSAYRLSDSLDAAGPVPAPYPVFVETPLIPEVDAIRVLPLDAPDADSGAPPSLFVAVTYPAPIATNADAGQYVLGVGVATGGPGGSPATLTTLATSPDMAALSGVRLFRANGDVYVYGSSGAPSAGLSVWTLDDDAAVPASPAPHALWAGMAGQIDGIGANGSTAAADIALEQQLSVGGYVTTISYYAGAVPYADLATWAPSAQSSEDAAPSAILTPVDNFTNVFTAPDGIPCGSAWSNDNIMLLGPGLAPADGDGGPASGLNMLWFDSSGAVRGLQSGRDALLLGTSGISNVAASPSSLAPNSAAWDVTWVETLTDDAGAYDVVFYNQLDCQ
jgi:hypothetical protein